MEEKKRATTVACAVILNEKGEVFLTQRNAPEVPEVHDRWQFPGGKVEFAEHPEDTVKREVLEETGFEVQVVRMLPGVLSNVYAYGGHAVCLLYECKVISGTFKADGVETKDGKFFKKEEIDSSKCLPQTDLALSLLD
jgi:mutator protein MutT